MACRLAFFPLGAPPLVYQTFAYHCHDPDYPMGDVPDETVVKVDECPDPASGLNLVEYDPETQELIITPIDPGSAGVMAEGAASVRVPLAGELEQKDDWHDVTAPNSPAPAITLRTGLGTPESLGL